MNFFNYFYMFLYFVNEKIQRDIYQNNLIKDWIF